MKKLTIKWNFFLITNYSLLVLCLLSILTGIISIVNKKDSGRGYGAVTFALIILILLSLTSILNIFIVHRYFPDNSLSLKTYKILKISRIVLFIITAVTGLLLAVGVAALITSPKQNNWTTISGIIFFGLLFLFSFYINVLQFKIPEYLYKRSTEANNQLIDSIGK